MAFPSKGDIARYVSLDRRSLSLMRVLLCLVALGDLAVRVSHIHAHYGVGSVYPPDALAVPVDTEIGWTFLSGVITAFPQFPIVMFAIAFASVSAVLIGYRTRLATPIACVAILVIQAMNPLLYYGSDVLIRLAFLIGVFLPWGDYFSIDQAQRRDARVPTRAASAWTLVLLLQISAMYVFAVLEKLTAIPWRDGSAAYFALAGPYATKIGALLLPFGSVLTVLTFLVLIVQVVAPILIFSPLYTAQLRGIVMILLMLFHVGLATVLNIGLFSFASVAVLASLMPGAWWDAAARRYARQFGQLTIYFDEKCAFCRRSSYLLRAFLLIPAHVRAAQSEPHVYRRMRADDSWVVTDRDGTEYVTYSAGVALLAHSPLAFFFAPVLRTKICRRIGERAYRAIARNRGLIPLPRYALPAAGPSRSIRYASVIIAVAFVSSMGFFCYRALVPAHIPPVINAAGNLTGTRQAWKLFVNVGTLSWNVIDGISEDGAHINPLYPDVPVYGTTPPPYVWDLYKDVRWHKTFETLGQPRFAYAGPYVAKYFCTHWNETHYGQDRLAEVIITKYVRRIHLDGKEGGTRTVKLAVVRCAQSGLP